MQFPCAPALVCASAAANNEAGESDTDPAVPDLKDCPPHVPADLGTTVLAHTASAAATNEGCDSDNDPDMPALVPSSESDHGFPEESEQSDISDEPSIIARIRTGDGTEMNCFVKVIRD